MFTRLHSPLAAFLLILTLHGLILLLFPPSHPLGKYPLAASQVIHHTLSHERLVDFSPLMLSLTTAAVKILPHPVLLLIILQLLLAALSGSLLFSLCKRFVPTGIAWLGVAAWALDPHIIVYERIVEPEILLLFFTLSFVLLTFRKSPRAALGAGFFFALALATRPTLAPLLIVVPFAYYIQGSRRRDLIGLSGRFLFPPLLMLLLLGSRMAPVNHTFSLSVMNPGTVFYEGNNPNSAGLSAIYPPLVAMLQAENRADPDPAHIYYRAVARSSSGAPLAIGAVNTYWMTLGLHPLIDNPRSGMKRLLRKAFYILHNYQWYDLEGARVFAQKIRTFHFPTTPWAFIVVLMLPGLLILRSRWRTLLIPLAILLLQSGVMIITYTSSRQRLILVPFALLFALLAIDRFSHLTWKTRSAFILFILILLPALLRPTDRMRDEDHLWRGSIAAGEHTGKALSLRAEGKIEEASGESITAMTAAPWKAATLRLADLPLPPQGAAEAIYSRLNREERDDPSSRFDLGCAAIISGHIDRAETIFQDLTDSGAAFKRDYYQSSEPLFYLGRCAEARGDLTKAMRLLARGVTKSPSDPWILSHLYILTKEASYRRSLLRTFDPLDVHLYLAHAAYDLGRWSEAADDAGRIVHAFPACRRTQIFYAAALSRSERSREAREHYRRAIALGVDPVWFDEAILNAFRKGSEENPNDGRALYALGVTLRHFGRFDEALACQEKAEKRLPGNPLIERERTWLQKAAGGL